MYEVDPLDTVVKLSDVPKPDIGAPLPMVLYDEVNSALAYLISEPDPAWDGSYVTLVTPESEDMAVTRVRFKQPSAQPLSVSSVAKFRLWPSHRRSRRHKTQLD